MPVDTQGYVVTLTGVLFNPLEPDPALVRTVDVFHNLANTIRWGGSLTHPITVAQHSVNVSEILAHIGTPAGVQMQGLLHDTAEAYLPDVVAGLKGDLIGFREIEARVERACFVAFDIPHPGELMEDGGIIKLADTECYRWEFRDYAGEMAKGLCQPPALKWPPMECWSHAEAENRLWDRYLELDAELNPVSAYAGAL